MNGWVGDIPISVSCCRTLSEGVGAEETDGVTVVELEQGGGGRDQGGLVHTSPARLQYGEDIQS